MKHIPDTDPVNPKERGSEHIGKRRHSGTAHFAEAGTSSNRSHTNCNAEIHIGVHGHYNSHSALFCEHSGYDSAPD